MSLGLRTSPTPCAISPRRNAPPTLIAGFLGHTNLLEGEADGEIAQTALGPVAINHHQQGPVRLSLRPEHLSLSAAPDDHHDCYYLLEHHSQRFCAIAPSHILWKNGEQVRFQPQRTATR